MHRLFLAIPRTITRLSLGIPRYSSTLTSSTPISSTLTSSPTNNNNNNTDTLFENKHKLSLIEACLRTGQISRAKHLYRSISSTSIADIHIHNSFLDAFVSSFPPSNSQLSTPNPINSNTSTMNSVSQFQELLSWFQGIKRYGLIPNLTTYAILFKGALKSELSPDFFKLVLMDLQRTLKDYPVHLDHLYESHVFEVEHVVKLKEIFHDLPSAHSPPPSLSLKNSSSQTISHDAKSTTKTTQFDFPVVNPTKTSNLEYIRKPLETVTKRSQTLEDQIEIEQESFRVNLEYLLDVSDKRRSATGIGILPPTLKRLATTWHKQYLNVLENQISRSKVHISSDNTDIGPFLALFSKCPEKISVVVVSQFLRSFSEGKPITKALGLVQNIGEGIEQEYKMMVLTNKRLRERLSKDYHRQQDMLQSRKLLDTSFRKLQALDLDTNINGGFAFTNWERPLRIRIGSVLASWFLEVAKVRVESNGPSAIEDVSSFVSHENAFTHDYIREAGKLYGVFKAHDVVSSALEASVSDATGTVVKGIMLPKLLPMVVPPKPWLTSDSGGYITIKTSFMRTEDYQAENMLREDVLSGRIETVLNGVDVLGQTAWRVNERLLRYMIQAWNTGKPIGGLPPEISDSPPCPPPKPADFEEKANVRAIWYKEHKKNMQEYFDLKGLRATENYKLEIARAFVGKTIYFPHNIDFRGRAYPIPQLFSHMGNDLARSLLIFDKSKPLGSNGLKWLKIHFANVYGFDKCSFKERESFVDANMKSIIKSAEDPFGEHSENQFWLGGDKPWLTLSVAMELEACWKSGNPETYESRLPIHQDGSCNGLQHYAALGGDIEGATQVNLVPSSSGPQDVYMAVAERVKELIARDLEIVPEPGKEVDLKKGIISKTILDAPEGKYALAKLITPERIERKIVKQTVMTTVYGVTFVGAREQVRNRLKEKYSNIYTPDEINMLSRYVALKVFSSMNNMFKGAREIMTWFSASAREIARSVPEEELRNFLEASEKAKTLRKIKKTSGIESQDEERLMSTIPLNSSSSVSWTTPLGLTIVQPYKYTKTAEVKTALQTFKISNPGIRSPVDISKQTSAFPPNFVHSLDATHMIMTALECQRLEDPLSFAAVHDSYWTHACDVDRLRTLLRDKFVELHSQPILEKLAADFMEKFRNRKVLNVYKREDMVQKLDEMNKGNLKYKLDAAKNAIVYDGLIMKEIDETELENENLTDKTALVDDEIDESEVSHEKNLSENDLASVKSVEDDVESHERKLGIKRRNQKYFRVWEDLKIPALPDRGTFDVNQVKESEYFFN